MNLKQQLSLRHEKTAGNSGMLSGSLIVDAVYDPKSTSYNADSQKLRIFRYAWDNAPTGWDDIFDYKGKKKYGIEITAFGKAHGLGLGQDEVDAGSYPASNAFGAKVTVHKIKRNVFSLFDRPFGNKGKRYTSDSVESWAYDGVGDYQSAYGVLSNTGFVEINLPIEVARTAKDTIRANVVFRPKAPYFATGDRHWSPKVSNPNEIDAQYNAIVGDILCVLITTKDGKVLRAIDTSY